MTTPTPQARPSARDVETVLAEVHRNHFVMWHKLDETAFMPRGEWRCSCGLKFGFSDSAIAHVAAEQAAALRALPTADEALAKAWDEGRRTGTSRAMRHMSDEPSLPLASAADNPYLTTPPAPTAPTEETDR